MGTSKSPMTFIADVELAQKLRVSVKAASTTVPPEVEIADATTHGIGTNDYLTAVDQPCSVTLFGGGGSVEVVAAGAFAVGATLYPAASGEVDDAVSGDPLGTALEEATASGDIVEMLPIVNTT